VACGNNVSEPPDARLFSGVDAQTGGTHPADAGSTSGADARSADARAAIDAATGGGAGDAAVGGETPDAAVGPGEPDAAVGPGEPDAAVGPGEPDAAVAETPDATVVETPDAAVAATPDATVVETPDAAVAATPDAAVVATPDAAVVAMPDAATSGPVLYRVGYIDVPIDFLDPTVSYTGFSWEVLSSLLVRNLVGYRHVAGAAGAELVPDLATTVPAPTNGGLTYTYTLRPGVSFGPPLNRAITSHDVEYAFRRMMWQPMQGGPSQYFIGLIAGTDGAPFATLPDSISGIETPDDQTIVFTLTAATREWNYLLSMPVASPLPAEVAGCFTEGGPYEQDLVASGPYQIEGAATLDASSCGSLVPLAASDYTTEMRLERNPAYDPASDEPGARPALVDGFHFTAFADTVNMTVLLEAGQLEEDFLPAPDDLNRYLADPALADRAHLNPAPGDRFLYVRLTQPPMDDVHVRRAIAFAIDRTALVAAFGGTGTGAVTAHFIPAELTGDHPTDAEYAPYPVTADLARAKAEMAQSKYDLDGDGQCNAHCDVIFMRQDRPRLAAVEQAVADALAPLGLRVVDKPQPIPSYYPTIGDPRTKFHLATGGWFTDFPDAVSMVQPLLASSAIATTLANDSLTGLTPTQAAQLKATGNTDNVPSLDTQITACETTVDTAQRYQCWRDLDVQITEAVVPMVTYQHANNPSLTGAAVTGYDSDAFTSYTSFAHVSVDPTRQH
jgi:peptide/nickel transport system substrate-binding protein